MQRLGRVLLTIVILGGTAWPILTGSPVNAKGWSWQSGQPVVRAIEPTDESNGGWCRGVKVIAEVDHRGTREVCLTDELPTSGLRWGYYFDNGYQVALISLAHEAKFHAVNGLGYDVRITHYSATTDTMVIGYPIGAMGKLRVYKNVLWRLTKDRLPSGEVVFNFNGSNVDFNGSQAWYVGSVGLSNNGRFAAVELRDYGVALVDLSTYETKLITDQYIRYDYGSDPYTEYAVSNDGSLVARAGMNVSLQVFMVSDGCGATIGTTEGSPRVSISGCPTVNLPYEKFAPSAAAFYAPSFSDSGGLLRFYVRDRGLGGRFVTLAAAGFQAEGLSYLALGDSYTSGEGETDDKFYAIDTNTDYEKCHLSERSYPFVYGLQLGLPIATVKSVACSGASSGDIIGSDDNYWGQAKRLGSGGLNLSDDERRTRQAEALNSFTPGRVHQLAFVEKYNPQLITVGIGGNDSGLFGKLAACAMPGDCEWTSEKGKAQTIKEINSLESKLVATYRKIKQAAPNSLIYSVNYPEVINTSGHCDTLTAAMFSSDERQLIDKSIVRINDVIDQAAVEAGIKVLDIEASFVGHRLCDDSKQPAVSDLRLGDDFGPTDWLSVIGNETFHPTPYGHELIAGAIYQQLSQPDMPAPECGNDCRNHDDYWPSDALAASYPSANNVDLTTTPEVQTLDMSFGVQLSAYSMAPASTAEINIDGIKLWSDMVNPDGSLAADLALPEDLSQGIHTIHIEGDSPSGEAVDDYEVISYKLPVQDKADGQPSESSGDDSAASDGQERINDESENNNTHGEAAVVSVNPPSWRPGYNPFQSIVSWGWRLPVNSLKPIRPLLNSTPDQTPKSNQGLSGKSSSKARSAPAVLGWRDQQLMSWQSWLFGPMVWFGPNQLAPWGRAGIMGPWLIFVE